MDVSIIEVRTHGIQSQQVPICERYLDPLSLSAWMCFFGTGQSAILAIFLAPDFEAWKITSILELLSCLFVVRLRLSMLMFIFTLHSPHNFFVNVKYFCREFLVLVSPSTYNLGPYQSGALSSPRCSIHYVLSSLRSCQFLYYTKRSILGGIIILIRTTI